MFVFLQLALPDDFMGYWKYLSWPHLHTRGQYFISFAKSIRSDLRFNRNRMEIIGVTVGETQNPRREIPRAIKLTFWRIFVFYIVSVFLIGTLIPYNDRNLHFALSKANPDASASPFVVAILESGIGHDIVDFLNACMCIFVFSSANSNFYVAIRTLYGLAKEKNSPIIFARVNRRGVPIYALGLSTLFVCIAFFNVIEKWSEIFKHITNFVIIFGLLTWISVLVSHICFVKARQAQNIENHELTFMAPWGLAGSYFALIFCIIIVLFKNFDVFIHDKSRKGAEKFDWINFITGYFGVPMYLIMIFGYKLYTKSERRTKLTADLFTGKEEIDREEDEFLTRKATAREHNRWSWFYRHFISWLL